MQNRIKCGKCQSEYHPRQKENSLRGSQLKELDYSCPVCGHGKISEISQTKKGTILLDGKIVGFRG